MTDGFYAKIPGQDMPREYLLLDEVNLPRIAQLTGVSEEYWVLRLQSDRAQNVITVFGLGGITQAEMEAAISSILDNPPGEKDIWVGRK